MSAIQPPGGSKVSFKVSAKDPKFTKSEEFPPNKADLWKSPVDEDGWYLEHCNLRSEIAKMTEVLAKLKGNTLEPWEVVSIKAWFANHNSHVHEHHQHEDEIFTPFMETRILVPKKLTTDHVPLVKALEAVMQVVESDFTTTAALSAAFAKYAGMMIPHLKEEEEVGLPLFRAYFTPEEGAVPVQEILSKSPPHILGGFFYHLDALGGSKAAINQFMANEGIPWFVYYIAFKGMVTKYYDTTQVHIDALLAGVPPAPPPKKCFYC